MKYSPGPWHVERTGTPKKRVLSGQTVIAHIRHIEPGANEAGNGKDPSATNGNAHLIAAAPSMLEFVLQRADMGDLKAQEIARAYRLRELEATP